VDYFGPVNVNEGKATKGRKNFKKVKNWACIFTCLVTRAVHLELAEDCSAQCFLAAFVRFSQRRGMPKTVLSDNGTNFVLGAKVVRSFWDEKWDDKWQEVYSDQLVRRFAFNHKILWKHIAERAPWQGGTYERLIKNVKAHLRPTIGRAGISSSNFATLLTQVEGMVNSRPLTYISDDRESDYIVLRPLDFLLPMGAEVVPPVMGDEDVDPNDEIYQRPASSREALTDLMNEQNRRLKRTWTGFYHHHLASLRERQRSINDSHLRLPRVGEVVIVHEDETVRGRWKTARIVELIKSGDGKIRNASLKDSAGHKLKRALRHLYPLETEDEVERCLGEPQFTSSQEEAFGWFYRHDLEEKTRQLTKEYADKRDKARRKDILKEIQREEQGAEEQELMGMEEN